MTNTRERLERIHSEYYEDDGAQYDKASDIDLIVDILEDLVDDIKELVGHTHSIMQGGAE